MEDLFTEFQNKLLKNKITKLNENSITLNHILRLKFSQISDTQKLKIIEKIYLISQSLETINNELEEFSENINTLSPIDIPNELSQKILEELEFKDKIQELLPIYCYLFLMKNFSY